jgi:hypothetical protein
MNAQYGSNVSSTMFSRGTMVIVGISLIIIYFAYNFLYGSSVNTPTVLVPTEITTPPSTPLKSTDIPQPFEGGEYTFNTWVYVNNFRDNINLRKPIFELQGTSPTGAFSTLYVGLGAQSNTLVVRTHSKSAGTVEGFQAATDMVVTPSSSADGALFLPYTGGFMNGTDSGGAGDSGLTSPGPTCDLPSVDLQRWVMVTVVLSGRTIDVYMDGKLSRSCVTKSYYKVDPAGVIPVILGGGKTSSLNGYVSGLSVARYALTPGEIYRMYSSGPKSNQSFMDWLMSFVTGSQPQK